MTSTVRCENAHDVHAATGREVCVTEWVAIDQRRIDQFAEATGDFQWIHVDTARAAKESPYGETIAHGFLTLSLLGKFYEDYMSAALPFCGRGLNYGLNKVRFTSPVRVNSKVRGRITIRQVEDVEGGLQLTFGATIELEGQDRPALVAESIVRRYLKEAA